MIAARPRRGMPLRVAGWLHDRQVSKRAEYMFAYYSGSLAEPGDRNPYADQSSVVARLWMRGYRRMIRVRIDTGPAMRRYRGELPPD